MASDHGVDESVDEAAPPAAEAPDLSTTAGKLADLKRRVARGRERRLGAGAVEKQHSRGKKTARERHGDAARRGLVRRDGQVRAAPLGNAFGQDEEPPLRRRRRHRLRSPSTAVTVAVFAQDFTVFGGSLGEVYGEKIVKVMDFAMKIGCPVIGLNDSGGARIQEGVVSLGLYGEIFRRNVQRLRRRPADLARHGAVRRRGGLLPAITDFTVMVDQTSHMFITGPDVIKTVTGEDVGKRGTRRRALTHTIRVRALRTLPWAPTR